MSRKVTHRTSPGHEMGPSIGKGLASPGGMIKGKGGEGGRGQMKGVRAQIIEREKEKRKQKKTETRVERERHRQIWEEYLPT
eukprot:1354312-Amorphochlora_amoeboformis.AAC.2